MVSFSRLAFKVSDVIVSLPIVSGTVATVILFGGLFSTGAAWADSASSLQDIGGANTSDPFSSRGDNSSGVMQLIHSVMQGEGNIDRAELRASQKENVSEATSDFFTKQRDRLRSALKTQPTAPGIVPNSVLGTSNLTTNPNLLITAPIVPTATTVEVTVPQAPVK